MSNERHSIRDPLSSIARRQPIPVSSSSTLRELAEFMTTQACSAVVVSRRNGTRAVVTERDIVTALARGSDPDDDWAVDVMSTDLRSLDGHEPIIAAARLMHDAVIRHVVVPDDSGELGLVSLRDLLGPFLDSIED